MSRLATWLHDAELALERLNDMHESRAAELLLPEAILERLSGIASPESMTVSFEAACSEMTRVGLDKDRKELGEMFGQMIIMAYKCAHSVGQSVSTSDCRQELNTTICYIYMALVVIVESREYDRIPPIDSTQEANLTYKKYRENFAQASLKLLLCLLWIILPDAKDNWVDYGENLALGHWERQFAMETDATTLRTNVWG